MGAATRCPRRRRPFHFFRDLAFFGDSEDSGFGDTTTDDDGTGLPPLNPNGSSNRKSPKFWRQFFLGDFKKGAKWQRLATIKLSTRALSEGNNPMLPNPIQFETAGDPKTIALSEGNIPNARFQPIRKFCLVFYLAEGGMGLFIRAASYMPAHCMMQAWPQPWSCQRQSFWGL